MRLITPYAPGSFRKPCLVVSTFYVSTCRETAVAFVEALNGDHALRVLFDRGWGQSVTKASDWVVIQQHDSETLAIASHLDLVAPFKNGGSEEEWRAGWEPYLALYEQWCPAELRGEAAP